MTKKLPEVKRVQKSFLAKLELPQLSPNLTFHLQPLSLLLLKRDYGTTQLIGASFLLSSLEWTRKKLHKLW